MTSLFKVLIEHLPHFHRWKSAWVETGKQHPLGSNLVFHVRRCRCGKLEIQNRPLMDGPWVDPKALLPTLAAWERELFNSLKLGDGK